MALAPYYDYETLGVGLVMIRFTRRRKIMLCLGHLGVLILGIYWRNFFMMGLSGFAIALVGITEIVTWRTEE